MSAWAHRRPRMLMVAGVAAASVALAGCSGSSPSGQPGAGPGGNAAANQPSRSTPTTATQEPVLPATLTASVEHGATDVPVDTAVSVTAANGTLESVVFTDAEGTRLPGRFTAGRTAWTAAEFLNPAVDYTLRSTARGAEGTMTHATTAFTSVALTLDQQTYPSVTPLAGEVMGIGMPVIVTFDVPVTDRAEFQRHMTVSAEPAQAGGWQWVSGQEAHWRPRTYWQPGTNVDVDLRLNGVDAGNGIYGQENRQISFAIGRSVLIKADVSTDKMRVYVDGSVARTIPITGGKPGGFQTRSGIKVISERFRSKRMNSATVGINPNSPDGYNIANVRFPMRITNSGEFLHAAPWSVYAQGRYNVSHGCIGMNTSNARWLFGLAKIGTPVEVTGNNRPLEPGNGWTDWDQSWTEYKAASALSG